MRTVRTNVKITISFELHVRDANHLLSTKWMMFVLGDCVCAVHGVVCTKQNLRLLVIYRHAIELMVTK